MAAADLPTLTQRDLNRALLARQLLLERSTLPVPRVLERVGGLQAQYAPAVYVGLWTRVTGFARADRLREALAGGPLRSPLPPSVRRELAAEIERLAAFHA